MPTSLSILKIGISGLTYGDTHSLIVYLIWDLLSGVLLNCQFIQ